MRSVLGKKWIINNEDLLLPIFERITKNRPHQSLKDIPLHDSGLLPGIEKALKRIQKAIDNKERIIIFGDYDVDGITGTAILFDILKRLNAKVSFRLPNRMEDGYGLSTKFLRDFKENRINLLITVDCGISCAKEVEKFAHNKIDTIITDHHTIPENLPEKAVSIVHPKLPNSNYPFKELTGAGVALKLAQALIKKHLPDEEKALTDHYIQLAALGTVADMGPLLDENRAIVKQGLQNLKATSWYGLKELLRNSKIDRNNELTSQTIGFRLAPRINAAGRIGDPYKALFLLLQGKDSPKLKQLGTELENLNLERQRMTYQAIFQAQDVLDKYQQLPNIIVLEHPDWHVGILGLIAGRLVEKYSRPVLIMQDQGDSLTGSARSLNNINITSILTSVSENLESFGGHSGAAGFSLKKSQLPKFKKAIEKVANKQIKASELTPILEIDCTVNMKEMTDELITQLNELKPFGIQNQKPKFMLKNISPNFISQVGREKRHLKFSAYKDDKNIDVIGFNLGEHISSIKTYKSIDLVFELEKNYFNGREKLQFKALDFRQT